jgi:hypothetical protein
VSGRHQWQKNPVDVWFCRGFAGSWIFVDQTYLTVDMYDVEINEHEKYLNWQF